jgi:hypothetical protein
MGQLFALFVLTVAAAESAIGLAILVITFRIRGTIAVEFRATVRIAYSHCLAIWKLFAVLRYQPYSKPRETLFRVPGIELTQPPCKRVGTTACSKNVVGKKNKEDLTHVRVCLLGFQLAFLISHKAQKRPKDHRQRSEKKIRLTCGLLLCLANKRLVIIKGSEECIVKKFYFF